MKKGTRKNKSYSNIFVDGGELSIQKPLWGSSSIPQGNIDNIGGYKGNSTMVNTSSSGGGFSFGGSGGGGGGMGQAGGIASAAESVIKTGIENAQIADTTGIEDLIKEQLNMVVKSNNLDDLMSEWGSWNKSKDSYTKSDVRGTTAGKQVVNALSAGNTGALAGMAFGPVGAIIGGVVGTLASGIGSIIGSNKAKRKAKKLNEAAEKANERALTSFNMRSSNIDTLNDLGLLSNYAAYGGPLSTFGSLALNYELANKNLNTKELDAMGRFRLPSMPNSFEAMPEFKPLNTFAKGGKIHIKPENKGKFTEYCGGKVTSACIAKGKKSSSPAVRKRATFALNARGWHHADGGVLYTNGANWTNGLREINEGGSHEENPYEGIPMSVDELGKPNLVEEGETLFNDYVFSDRLKASKNLLATYKLPTNKADKTFSEIARALGKESLERPNDPISNNGLEVSMNRLTLAQEEIRAKEDSKLNNKFAKGGLTKSTLGMHGYTPASIGTPGYTPMNFDKFSVSDYYVPGTPFTYAQLEQLFPEEVYNPSTPEEPTAKKKGLGLDMLRFAPALGAGAGVIGDLFGANRPDYSNAEALEAAAMGIQDIEAEPIGNYLSYNPLDRDYYINKLNANAGATRRALMNTSGGNRANAQAGILAADYNYGENLGSLARQAEEYNQLLRERVEGFNRQTNIFNSEAALRAAGLNKQADELKFRAMMAGALMRDQSDTLSSLVRSLNLTNLFDSLGDIGRELFTLQQIKENPALDYYADWRGATKYKTPTNKKSKGGKIKKGLTY